MTIQHSGKRYTNKICELAENLTVFLCCVYLFELDKKKDKKVKGAEEARGRRNAIRLSREYTLETVVVADENMVQYHGAEAAQRFLLTVMNMVRQTQTFNTNECC